MKKKTSLIIPCLWSEELLTAVQSVSGAYDDIEIGEMYGAVSGESVGHGRPTYAVPEISRVNALKYRRSVNKTGLKYTYLLNAPFRMSKASERSVLDYLDWVVNDFGADSVMISSYDLMEVVRKRFPQIPIFISSIAGVASVRDLKQYMKISPTRVVLSYDANREFEELAQICDYSQRYGVDVELILADRCIRNCDKKEQHYIHLLTDTNGNRKFPTTCSTRMFMRPREFVKAPFIRPEDLEVYENLGVRHFKLVGRTKTAPWVIKALNAYVRRCYDGNLMEVLGNLKESVAGRIILNNRSLDGFLRGYPSECVGDSEDRYCEMWIQRLWKSGAFCFDDDTEFRIDSEGWLSCVRTGSLMRQILKKEG